MKLGKSLLCGVILMLSAGSVQAQSTVNKSTVNVQVQSWAQQKPSLPVSIITATVFALLTKYLWHKSGESMTVQSQKETIAGLR